MGRNGYAEEGSLKISEEVIATIANTAASDVRGVAGLSPRPIAAARGPAHRRQDNKAIRIEVQGGEAVLDLFVNLYMGARIPDVATEIQSRVKDAVQNMTGVTVSKVHVHVAGVVLAPQDPAQD